MESHVNGGITPPSLGALRCDLLAMLIGNSLFTKEEQLRANHHTHECECPQRLELWLRNVRRESEYRQRAAQAAARILNKQVGYDAEAPAKELCHLFLCPALTRSERQRIPMLPELPLRQTMNLVGQFYVNLLRRSGRLNEC